MSSLKEGRVKELGLCILGHTAKHCRLQNMKATVSDGTWSGYASEARWLMKVHQFCCHSIDPSVTRTEEALLQGTEGADRAMEYVATHISQAFFSQYIHARAFLGISNIREARFALMKAQDSFGGGQWAKAEEVAKETDGAESVATMIAGKESSVGSIDFSMLKQLTHSLTCESRISMRRAMLIQFYAALRFSELINLRAGDVRDGGIVIRRPKTHRARDIYKNRVMFKRLGQWKAGQAALELLEKASRGKASGEVLFPWSEWNGRAYNAEIKAAARLYKWPSSVRFRGSHSLRHGGVALAAEELEGRLSAQEIASLLEMSVTNYYRYRASNKDRALADTVGKENRKAWLATHTNAFSSVAQTCKEKLKALLNEDSIYTSSDSEGEGEEKPRAMPIKLPRPQAGGEFKRLMDKYCPTLDFNAWKIDLKEVAVTSLSPRIVVQESWKFDLPMTKKLRSEMVGKDGLEKYM